MSDFLPVAKVSDIPDPGKLLIEIADRLVVLFHAGGKFYCIDDVCTHDGGPLSEGELDTTDCTISCPRHGAKFDFRDGRAVSMPAIQPTVSHEVKIEGENVLVQLND
jgi:3-phenylpropionate/trans-cinnamate dioxygenase ferredoxin subunit